MTGAPPVAPGTGRYLRLLPLVSILAYVGLALVMVSAYERDAIWGPICRSIPLGVGCLPARSLWLSLAVLWSGLAGVLGILVAMERHRIRKARGIRIPPLPFLASVLGVTAVAALWLWTSGEAAYGRLPRALDGGLLLGYVTASLLLFALAFLADRPRSDTRSRWAAVLAVINGVLGFVLAMLFAYAVLNPPVFA